MLRKRLDLRSQRRGVEIVELAIVLPVLVLMVLGIIEFGRAFQVAHDFTTAAREGARLGMLYNVLRPQDISGGITSVDARVKNDVKSFLSAMGYNNAPFSVDDIDVLILDENGNDTGVTLDDTSAIAEQYFMIRVQANFDDFALIPPTYLSGRNITGEIVVRHE